MLVDRCLYTVLKNQQAIWILCSFLNPCSCLFALSFHCFSFTVLCCCIASFESALFTIKISAFKLWIKWYLEEEYFSEGSFTGLDFSCLAIASAMPSVKWRNKIIHNNTAVAKNTVITHISCSILDYTYFYACIDRWGDLGDGLNVQVQSYRTDSSFGHYCKYKSLTFSPDDALLNLHWEPR